MIFFDLRHSCWEGCDLDEKDGISYNPKGEYQLKNMFIFPVSTTVSDLDVSKGALFSNEVVKENMERSIVDAFQKTCEILKM